jgi:sugar lactone lactonase YvrE
MKRPGILILFSGCLLLSPAIRSRLGEAICQRVGSSAKQSQPISAGVGAGKTAFPDTELGVITTVVADRGCRGCSGGIGGDGGPAKNAQLYNPRGLFVDPSGNLFIADSLSHRIRRIDAATGVITTIAGNPRCFQGRCDGSFGGDGGLATAAELNVPTAIISDADGNLFIADYNNNRVRRVDKTTGIITTVVGSFRGFSGDDGPARNAELNGPMALAIDSSGNLFIADSGNARIRRVDARNGIITTAVGRGRGDSSGDGKAALNAGLPQPMALFIEASGDLLIASGNSIRRVDHATGMISTVAGGNGKGVAGDGGPAVKAQLYLPQGIAKDGSGNLFISDSGNHRVRRVDLATGVITTIVGTGKLGYGGGFSGDGGPAIGAELMSPWGVTTDAAGNLLISDANNNRIRRIQMTAPIGGDFANRK